MFLSIIVTSKDEVANLFATLLLPDPACPEIEIIIKLDNGYNIGVATEGAKLSVLSKAKLKETIVETKKKNKDLQNITILGTGGTIASFIDYKTGAVSPAITAEQLVNSVKALDEIANINAEPLFSLAAEDMKPNHWEDMAIKVKEIHDKNNHGIVIGHGTDTMAYSAAALAFQLPEISNPVVFTGAQRKISNEYSQQSIFH